MWKLGVYLNPGTRAFEISLNSKIYVDKSGLIEKTNALIGTQQQFVCVSRPRRFGKSMAAEMLASYYDRSVDSSEIFDKLNISSAESYREHLNKYDVIRINMQDFLSISGSIVKMLEMLQMRVVRELKKAYPDYVAFDNIVFAMQDIFDETGRCFVILIDEWDCIFREYKNDLEAQKKYLD